MMEIPVKYDPTAIESKWYAYWLEKNYFHSVPDAREPYTIVIPPPNVTGVLHMGHMLNNTIQDVLIRRARMIGKNALWVPGTDHASIATEAKVVAKLRDEGIEKANLSRDEFLAHAWEWKEKHGGIILEQLKKLGASCDWDRTCFTMDPARYESVIQVFVDLYDKGLIYRGIRMVNWDPKALTALSDEEVIYKEVQSKLYYIRYKVEGSNDDWVTIATTRPETILGDTAVCYHPEDGRFAHLQGNRVLVPLLNRSIPMISDEYVDREFGTGCLKITPAHDVNDYALGQKYKLDSIDIFNPDGTLGEKAGLYIGMDRFEVRKRIVDDLDQAGNLVKVEDYTNKVGYSERTHVVIEPKLSMQWFLRMPELAKPALEAVTGGEIKFHPEKFINTYRHWMENVRDWCISRQLWWGQRIPAWYLPDHSIVVAKTEAEALTKAQAILPGISADQLRQDEDVLDTWFSSWLWPISVFDGIRHPDNEEINYYYPTNDLVTAPEILFFWVARMIMAGKEYRGEIPFRNVYLTGIVRDKLGRKMSKSLGNSPDPLDLIAQFGADGVRVGMLLTSPAGNDLPFDESLCEQGRNFNNKVWNALRLVNGWNVDENLPQPGHSAMAVKWFQSCFDQALATIEDHFNKYRLSDALMTAYKLVWDDFCAWYLEIVKPAFGQPIDKVTLEATLGFFKKLMQVLHPFMPFITEEIWHNVHPSQPPSIMISDMPAPSKPDDRLLAGFGQCVDIVSAIRNIRNEKQISFKDTVAVYYQGDDALFAGFAPVIVKLANLSDFAPIGNTPPVSVSSFLVGTTEFMVPIEGRVDKEAEVAKIKAEMGYLEGFRESVLRKLSNEKFVANAKAEVVDIERKKLADAESKLAALKRQIELLG